MTEPSLSPDRKEIAFVSGGDIWSVPAEGGVARLLVSHAATESKPLFSPDGKYLAFGSNRTGGGDIYILDLESGNLRRLTFDDSNEQLDAWSRDGKWIYFTSPGREISGGDIYRVPATGGTPMQVSADRYTNEFEATPLADGSIIFAARGNANGQWWRKGRSHLDESEIWEKKGDEYERLTTGGAKQMWPMATADGSKIFFMSDRTGPQNLWVMQRGGQAKQLTNFSDGRVLWPTLSYDGQEIVFERNFRIWEANTSNGKAAEVPITLRGAASSPLSDRITLGSQIREVLLSPDGKKVAVIAHGEVFAASARDGGEAARITNTAAAETYLAWTSDSRKLIFGSERNGGLELYQYDFSTETESKITSGTNTDAVPVVSPDGKSLAFIRNSRLLMVYDLAPKQEREVCKIYADTEPLQGSDAVKWSPDSKWIAFLTYAPETRSYTNVSVVPATGGAARPISFLANSNAGSLQWSSDGSYILFGTSQRTEDSKIARIDLKLRTPKFREDSFRDLFKEENPRQRPTQPAPAPTVTPTPSPAAVGSPALDGKTTEIVFDDIRRRTSFLTTGLNNGSAVISPDGKTIVLIASAEGQVNLYTMTTDELANDQSPKQLTSTSGFKSQVQFSPDSKEVYYLEGGRVNVVTLDRREVRPLSLTMDMAVNFPDEKMEVFKQGWRYMRDNFFDEKFNGVDWNAMRTQYEPLVAAAKNMDEVRRLMNMMVGELNSSHLGVGGPSGFTPAPIGKLGLRFDRAEYESNGRLKVTEVITLGPAAITKNINIGDYIISVDGVKIGAGVNLDEQLENKVNKRVSLIVSGSADGAGKEVIVKPVSTVTERNLLYRQWVEGNRAYVDRISGGKLGYVHLRDMGQASLDQLYIDLDAENQRKEGVVIDIRNNNGGFINPYVIDVLSRKGYLTMQERGLWAVPGRSSLGQRALERPTVLVTNSHSLSDAEDFTEGYRSLKLGKVVGEPTSGWIIFTWDVNLFDGTTFRLPRSLILGSDSKKMELNPRPVDVPVSRPIGETYTGRDSQLDAAVKTLLGQ